VGPIRDLERRVAEYHRRGAIAYIPSKAKKWDLNGPYQPIDLPSDWQEWIVKDHEIIRGAPSLRGTRLDVKLVKNLLNSTFEEIKASYPQLTDEHVAVALVAPDE
jgi:uncharacterized protein (DUF433 family)